MKIIKTIAVTMFLLASAGLYAQKAYIQMEADPGISVFLDNTFKGITSSDMGGLIIEDVSPGRHSLKVVKKGFNPQVEQITVKAGEVYTYKVKPFIPKLKITESGNTGQQQIELKVGKLKIQSIPVSVNISIPALSINTTKSKDEWLAEDVPVGTYAATFKKGSKTLSYQIEIKSNKLTHLFVNIMSGKVEDRSAAVEQSNTGQTLSSINYGSVTDTRDGQTYKTIQIGSQTWFAENLNYKTGTSWCFDNVTTNCNKYGRLYDLETAKRACPKGWHLPSDAEWGILIDFLGGSNIAGNKMKSTSGWSNNGNGTDEVGFSALPGGYRYSSGYFNDLGNGGYWWSATEYGSPNAWYRGLYYKYDDVARYSSSKDHGFSVRCVRD